MSDLIDRWDAIQKMLELYNEDLEAYGVEIPEMFDCDRAIEALQNLPSAEPVSQFKWERDVAIDQLKKLGYELGEKPRRGKWIPVTNGRGGFECNQCHCYAPSYQDGVEWLSDFCPACGVDMRGDKE